jgi:hypothetical protein
MILENHVLGLLLVVLFNLCFIKKLKLNRLATLLGLVIFTITIRDFTFLE